MGKSFGIRMMHAMPSDDTTGVNFVYLRGKKYILSFGVLIYPMKQKWFIIN